MSKRIPSLLCALLVLAWIGGESHCQTARSQPPLEGRQAASALGVLTDGTDLREAPSVFSSVVSKAEKGDALLILEQKGEWYLVELRDGRSGWAHQSVLAASLQNPEAVKPTPEPEVRKPEGPERAPQRPEKDEGKTRLVIRSDRPNRICLNFLNADVREALSALAMEREINISMSQEVTGKISVHLYDVTLDEALRAISLTGGFGYYKQDDLYYVYRPKQVRDPAAEQLQIRVYRLKYAGVEKIQEVLSAIPGIRTVKIHEPTRTVVIEDIPQNISKVETILAHWDRPPRQVMMEAKILEITLTDDMAFGVNWTKMIGEMNLVSRGFTTALPPPGTPDPGTGTGLFGNFISAAGTHGQITAALDFLQTKTKVNTLSTPKILALHGKPAKVQVGGKQGYKVTTTNVGVATETIQFIDTGTILEITPFIDDDDNILLSVQPSINSAKVEQGIPVVASTLVSTQLMVKNGETIFIGGLIQDTDSKTRDMVPCLGGIPLLGALFGRTVSGLGKSELIVLITPQILDEDAKNAQWRTIEKVRREDEKFSKVPQPDYKRYFDFMMPVK
jgi:type IV pilus secretin PilQ/predicted competence protein